MSTQKNILIIEDEPDIREAMTDAVAEAGYNVSSAEDGGAGLNKALEEKPDLILLDIKMPIMDGHEVLKRLRADEWGRTVKVIVLTAMDDVDNVNAAKESVITDYLIKTQSTLDEIVAKIKSELAQ